MANISVGIFAKAPEAASVKTRLIPALGVEGARAAHCELVTHTLTQIANRPSSFPSRFDTSLWVTEMTPTVQRWSTSFNLTCYQQEGRDLGMRMFNALDALLQGGAEGAGIVGTDCPTIDAEYVDRGCELLVQHDVVYGPALDGGYGLVMCRQAPIELFTDMAWGTDTVLANSLLRAKQLNLSVGLLDTIWDVDRPEDWVRYLQYREGTSQ